MTRHYQYIIELLAAHDWERAYVWAEDGAAAVREYQRKSAVWREGDKIRVTRVEDEREKVKDVNT